MHEARDDVAIVQVVVVVGSVDVRGNDGGEVAAVLRLVQVIEHVHHSFGVCVALGGDQGERRERRAKRRRGGVYKQRSLARERERRKIEWGVR